MANLTFPSNPTNGQKVTVNDKVFVYNSTTSRWTATRLQVLGNLTDDFTIPTPVVTLSANGQTLNSLSNNYITYSVDQDAKITIENQTTNATAVLYLSNNTIKIDPSLNELTNGVIRINASNGRTIGTANYVFSVDNQAPFISLANSFYYVSTGTAAFDVVVTGTDPENQPLTYSASITGGYANAISSITQSANVFTVTVTSDKSNVGNTVVTFSVDDGVQTKSANVNFYVSRGGIDWSAVTQQQKVLAPLGVNDYFGWSVGISGNTFIGGAKQSDRTHAGGGSDSGTNEGSATIFTWNGSSWGTQQTIEASDKQVNDWFGEAVAIDNDTVVVGARLEDAGGDQAGAAYVFARSGSSWTQQAKLLASDRQFGDWFGWKVDVSGNTVIVGAVKTNEFRIGKAYIFTRSGSSWSQQAILAGSDISDYSHQFGCDVAVDGDTAVVGAQGREAAYVFTRSGSSWTQQAKLTSGSGLFGSSVDISGDTIVVGASTADGRGAAYVFTRSGSTWTEQAKLVASDRQSGDLFGESVGISNDSVIVGAREEDSGQNRAGAAYLYFRDGTTWTQEAKIQASDRGQYDEFGTSVAIDNDRAVVGSPWEDPYGLSNAGAAYVFVSG